MAHWVLVVTALLSNPSPMKVPQDKVGPAGELPGMAPMAGLPEKIQIKKGVILDGLDERMYPAIHAARTIWLSQGGNLVITSGRDGRHRKGSLHYAGRALDFRTKHLDRKARIRSAQALRKTLGAEFRVLLEKDHIHVEYRLPQPGVSPLRGQASFSCNEAATPRTRCPGPRSR
jgi:hypothetical protein